MAGSSSRRLLLLCCLSGGLASLCHAQAYTPPPPKLTTLPPCPVPKDAKEAKKIAKRTDCDATNQPAPSLVKPAPVAGSAAAAFPFPGEKAAASPATPAVSAFPYPGEAPAPTPGAPIAQKPPDPSGDAGSDPSRADPNVPYSPAAAAKAAGSPPGKAFPYPGDPVKDPAPVPAVPDAKSGDPSATDSSSSSSASPAASASSAQRDESPAASDAAPKGDSTDDDDTGPPKLADKGSEGKRSRRSIKPQTDSERVDEDLSVARFYGEQGNSLGAYLRAKDAVKTEPEYPEAHFVLGEAARRLRKVDEAKAEFATYLKLAPDGQQAKAAEKALADLP